MNRRMLVLDDEPDFLEMYQFILAPGVETHGNLALQADPDRFELHPAMSGEEALQKIEESIRQGRPFAGGFFDIRLGLGIDGIETIRRAKDLDPNLICVLITGEVDRGIEEITRIFGPEFSDRWDFIAKPFTELEIRQKANNLVCNWDRRYREKLYVEEIQRQQLQLMRAERLAAVGTLARGIGHEFGNILHTVMGRAEIALRRGGPEEMQDALKKILESSERASVIVRNLQSLVQPDSKRERMSLRDPLQEAITLLTFEIKKANLKLVLDLDPVFPEIPLSRIEMSQAFLNILLNAIQAMEAKGGELKIATVRGEDRFALRFSDQGVGIAPENISRIFEPLYTTRPGVGSGIGLSVAKRVVESHGGRISVESWEGGGTTLILTFPLEAVKP